MTGPFAEIALLLFQGSRRWSGARRGALGRRRAGPVARILQPFVNAADHAAISLARDIRRDAPPAASREHIIQEDRAA